VVIRITNRESRFYVTNWKTARSDSGEGQGGREKARKCFVEGPKGKLDMEIPRRTSFKVEGDRFLVSRDGDDAEARRDARPWPRAREQYGSRRERRLREESSRSTA
jgi:hypothetical protein